MSVVDMERQNRLRLQLINGGFKWEFFHIQTEGIMMKVKQQTNHLTSEQCGCVIAHLTVFAPSSCLFLFAHVMLKAWDVEKKGSQKLQ